METWTQISRYAHNVGPKNWEWGDWGKDYINAGCLLRLAAVEESRLLMELMVFPLELALLLLEDLSFRHKEMARQIFAERTIHKAGVDRGKRVTESIRLTLWSHMIKTNRRCLKLPPPTLFKPRSKVRKAYRDWLALEILT